MDRVRFWVMSRLDACLFNQSFPDGRTYRRYAHYCGPCTLNPILRRLNSFAKLREIGTSFFLT